MLPEESKICFGQDITEISEFFILEIFFSNKSWRFNSITSIQICQFVFWSETPLCLTQ